MKQIGFIESLLLDTPYATQRRFNEAAAAISHTQQKQAEHEAATYTMASQLRSLFELDEAQGEEIARLRAVIEVLCKMLLEAGAIDETVFSYRLDAAIEESQRVKNEAIAADAARRAEAERARAASAEMAAEGVGGTTTCSACGEDVPSRATQFTESGVVCDACYGAADTR